MEMDTMLLDPTAAWPAQAGTTARILEALLLENPPWPTCYKIPQPTVMKPLRPGNSGQHQWQAHQRPLDNNGGSNAALALSLAPLEGYKVKGKISKCFLFFRYLCSRTWSLQSFGQSSQPCAGVAWATTGRQKVLAVKSSTYPSLRYPPQT